MKTAYFIAGRWIKTHKENKRISSPIIRMAVLAIALSMCVMILSVAVVIGFQSEIRKKVIGFGSHIQILNLDSNNSFETNPIDKEQDFLSDLNKIPEIKHIQTFATKPALIKTQTDIQGIIVKGVGSDYDWDFFSKNLVEGHILNIIDSAATDEILLSKTLSDMLNLKLNDEFAAFFIDERPRPRRFKVAGIFNTSLDDFDKQFILADIAHIQKLNNWTPNQISGFEILINDYKHLDEATWRVMEEVGFTFTQDGGRLKVISVKDKYPQIFDWLQLLDMNVWVILIIMILISVINMGSATIITILDRTQSIGLLKAIGGSNNFLRKVFVIQAAYLIGQGLLWGNGVALALGFLQQRFHLIKLDQASYFIDYAPVAFKAGWLILMNVGILLLIVATVYIPLRMIQKSDPVKSLRYE